MTPSQELRAQMAEQDPEYRRLLDGARQAREAVGGAWPARAG